MFEDYRRKRVAEMKREEKRGRFGGMEPLGRDDFVREVTEGSKVEVDEDGGVVRPEDRDDWDEDDEEDGEGKISKQRGLRGTGVVVFLFKDSYVTSLLHTS
jgi:hypothetical protein